MEKRREGTLLVTSATAAVRGNAGQHSHAAAMAGRRLLCQSLNAEFAAKGIHVAHILIDGDVDAPDTLGKMRGPERYQQLRQSKVLEKDGFLLPPRSQTRTSTLPINIDRRGRTNWICAPSRTSPGGTTFRVDLCSSIGDPLCRLSFLVAAPAARSTTNAPLNPSTWGIATAESLGGRDTGPDPYELVLAGLGACTAMTMHVCRSQENAFGPGRGAPAPPATGRLG